MFILSVSVSMQMGSLHASIANPGPILVLRKSMRAIVRKAFLKKNRTLIFNVPKD